MTAPPGWTWKQSHHSSNYNDGKRTIVWLLFDFDPPVHMCVVPSWSKYYSAIIPYFGWPYLGHLLRYNTQKRIFLFRRCARFRKKWNKSFHTNFCTLDPSISNKLASTVELRGCYGNGNFTIISSDKCTF